MEDTLGHGLVQGAGCYAQLLLSSSLVASGNGLAELADLGTDGGANGLVALTCLLVGDNALLLGLDKRKKKYLLVIESD